MSKLFRRGAWAVAAAGSAMLWAEAALAVTDKRAVSGAQSVVPAVPEPGAMLLFAAGAAFVGYTIHRRRSRG